ncbi:MAG: hypothetical protein QM664_15385 [Flavihumibacter sp.]
MFIRRVIYLICLFALACKRPSPAISFYYWKTTYQQTKADSQVLADNEVKDLYLRYFDLDVSGAEKQPTLLAPVCFAQSPDSNLNIVPVVYIKNNVFIQATDSSIPALAAHTIEAIQSISKTAAVRYREIQIDCDWTRQSRDRYFHFLRELKQQSGVPLSATIRLHQVKYPAQSGIPPVDRGLLMYYNMGYIADVPENSIYDEKTAKKYSASIPGYPLPMDLALPVFSWGIQIRNGKVVHLLNKMNASDLADKNQFIPESENRFRVKQAGFRSGYYFQENDVIKIEQVSPRDLKDIAENIRPNPRRPFSKVLFYDLDEANYTRYEKTIFKDIAAALR